jgi:hypothetical protein
MHSLREGMIFIKNQCVRHQQCTVENAYIHRKLLLPRLTRSDIIGWKKTVFRTISTATTVDIQPRPEVTIALLGFAHREKDAASSLDNEKHLLNGDYR